MKLFYSFGIRLYVTAIRIASLFNLKAKQWLVGRKQQKIKKHNHPIWFHCASLGEFEQARPIIEKIKQEQTEQEVVVTFFSPSGYEMRKNYTQAEGIYYLPADLPSRMHRFVDEIHPKAVLFVKYEIWPNLMEILHQRKTPTHLIAATFRDDQIYFKPWGRFFKKALLKFNTICTQDDSSVSVLKKYDIRGAVKAGDPRFDRVWQTRIQAKENEIIEQFKRNSTLLIAGSSWPIEEELLANVDLPENCKIIIAPHEIDNAHIKEIMARFDTSCSRYTQFSDEDKDKNILLLDTIGHLASAYKYADFAVVGGGFTNALHNILEPATFGIPVLYGNNHPKYHEGKDLAEHGGGLALTKAEFPFKITQLFNDAEWRKHLGERSKLYIESQKGATDRIYQSIFCMTQD